MKPKQFVLVSPGAIDGYPPVQYQARLLADAGYGVEVVTLPLVVGHKGARFEHPGVQVTCLPDWLLRPGRRALRVIALAAAVTIARLRAGRSQMVEICFDPIGLFISDVAPAKPRRRVLHLHELLQHEHLWIERRLRRAVKNLDLISVPDKARAEITRAQLGLFNEPLVIENYPMRDPKRNISKTGSAHPRFVVVYCGTLGFDQRLDLVIRSVQHWPDEAVLEIIGRDDTPVAKQLKQLTVDLGLTDRISFTGWKRLVEVEERLARADLAIALLKTDSAQWQTALGASNKRYQYMKAGLPQIGDNNPGVPELLEGGKIGACVPKHDPICIAQLVTAYFTDPIRCREEGERAFQFHKRSFNYQAVFSRFLAYVEASF